MDIVSIFSGMFSAAGQNMILLAILFIVFIYVMKKLFSLFFESILIVAMAVLFPFILVRFFSVPLALETETYLFFIAVGLGLLVLHKLVKIGVFLGKVLSLIVRIITAPFRWLFSGKKKKKDEE